MSNANYRLISLPVIQDIRGSLTPLDFQSQLGFLPKRLFMISDVAPGTIRGEHAHRECIQALHGVQGRIKIIIDDGRQIHEVMLENANSILVLPAMNWATIKFLDEHSRLVVYASETYSESDYLRNYSEFINLLNIGVSSGVQ